MAKLEFDATKFTPNVTVPQIPAPPVPPAPQTAGEIVLTSEQASYLGGNSAFLGVLDTPAKVLRHLELRAEDKARIAQATAALNVVRVTAEQRAVLAAAKQSKALLVEAANKAWREAVRERKEADIAWSRKLAEFMEARAAAMLALDAQVEALRLAYRTERDS